MSVVNAPRMVVVLAARAGRVAVRALRKSNARCDTLPDVPERVVAVRARDESVTVRGVTLARVATRDATFVSRVVTVVVEFVRDNESDPRTAADDAPKFSATATMDTIIFLISVYV